MTLARRPAPTLFSQVDVSSATHSHSVPASREDQTELLREILAAQDRTNDLLEELGTSLAATQKQRASELSQWRNAHPALAGACREAAEALTRVQIEYLRYSICTRVSASAASRHAPANAGCAFRHWLSSLARCFCVAANDVPSSSSKSFVRS